MQAAKPRPNLTFTYADPPEPPHPYYRMVLVFDAANDLTAMSVCAGEYPPQAAGCRPAVQCLRHLLPQRARAVADHRLDERSRPQ